MQAIGAPGQLFFCRRIEIPEDVADDERESFIQLQLEGMSPFPLEHMQFGFVVDEAKRFAFVYSGYRRSFENGSIVEWEKQEAVIPEFSIGLLAGKKDSGKPLLVVSETSLTYLEFDDESELPCCFESFPRSVPEEDEEAKDWTEEVEEVKARLGDRIKGVTIRVWNANTEVHIGKQKFRLRAEESGELISAVVTRDTLWTMDLREPALIDRAKLEERRNAIFWRVVQGMAAALILLIVGEIGWMASRAYISLRKGWNDEQAPIVMVIDSHDRTARELEEFEESDLVPFTMLVAIEPFRTNDVLFSKVETNGPNGLKVFATATSNGHANQFKARLERFEKIDSVELQDIQSRPSGTSFTALMNFKPGSFHNGQQSQEVANNG